LVEGSLIGVFDLDMYGNCVVRKDGQSMQVERELAGANKVAGSVEYYVVVI
jgi:hypothetical protein